MVRTSTATARPSCWQWASPKPVMLNGKRGTLLTGSQSESELETGSGCGRCRWLSGCEDSSEPDCRRGLRGLVRRSLLFLAPRWRSGHGLTDQFPGSREPLDAEDAEDDPDGGHADGDPREQVAGLGAKRRSGRPCRRTPRPGRLPCPAGSGPAGSGRPRRTNSKNSVNQDTIRFHARLLSARLLVLDGGDNPQELPGLEARPPDQGAVDVRLGEQFGGVVGLDAPPILDADRLGNLLIVTLLQDRCEGRDGPLPPARGWRFCPFRWPRPARRRSPPGPSARPRGPPASPRPGVG